MTDLAIETRGLVKSFGGAPVLRCLDLNVRRGTVYGLIGRNGAGKTTAIRLLMGLLSPTRGEARVLGEDMRRAAPPHRARVACVSQEARLPGRLTLEALGDYFASLYPRWDEERARRLATTFDVPCDRPFARLSGGQQRKAAILLALAARPEALFLDEPAAGLDPVARRELMDALIDALQGAEGLTVLLSTHVLADLERLADYIGILHGGKITSEGTLEELQGGTRRVQVVFEADAVPTGFSLPGVVRSETAGPVYTAVMSPFDEDALEQAREQHRARIQVFPLGLEDIFVELLGPTRGGTGRSDHANSA